ncbi:MAG: 5'-3' exonuclease H3TH domain-containing protein, partial [Kiloniellales bacterium]|nr:5'-3' exonuclease H3TH domain-containing protein [Kiloniellales bacterium]
MTKTAPYKHLYLIDGSGYIFRAYFAIPPRNASDGTPTNATFGFSNMILKLLRESDADAVAVVFDKGKTSFRNDFYPDYKAHRPDPPEDLIPQFEMIREATRAFNLPCIQMENYEADDIIATYARKAAAAGIEVTIISSDKDLMQLVGDGIVMMDPMKNKPIGPQEVVEKFGVPPDKVVEVQALAGDSVDNIPGVPGIGVKTAAQLIEVYGDLETLLARAEEIKQPKRRQNLMEFAEQARLSRRLVTLMDDVPVEEDLADFAKREFDPEALRAFLERYEFRSILARLADQLGVGDQAETESPAGAAAGYELVTDIKALKRWVAEAEAEGLVAVDTETTGLDPMRAELVGVSLSIAAGAACYIPVAHRQGAPDGELDLAGEGGGLVKGQIPRDKALKALKPLLEDP